MAKKPEIIFNCGISHVSVSIFSFDGNTLVLEEVGLHTLNFDYTKDSLWIDAVISGIKELSSELKLKGNARFIFPGSFLLTKTIRVPKVEKDKQDKIVGFELSQKMPFPLAELIWDYQVIDDDGVEQEILAFAVKPEVAAICCRAGRPPSEIRFSIRSFARSSALTNQEFAGPTPIASNAPATASASSIPK